MNELIHNYIVIEGNIGAGKTYLSNLIALENNRDLILEEFEGNKNEYLSNFYEYQEKNPSEAEKYILGMEMSFLILRTEQLKLYFNTKRDRGVVADYDLGKCLIFPDVNLVGINKNLHNRYFNLLKDSLPKPNLIVYLERTITNLQELIKGRNRPKEQDIPNKYLENIHEGYLKYFNSLSDQPILKLDVTGMNIPNKREHYKKVFSLINKNYPPGITHFTTKEILALNVD